MCLAELHIGDALNIEKVDAKEKHKRENFTPNSVQSTWSKCMEIIIITPPMTELKYSQKWNRLSYKTIKSVLNYIGKIIKKSVFFIHLTKVPIHESPLTDNA